MTPKMAAATEFDSDGNPVVSYSPEIRDLLGLDGATRPPATLYDTQHAVRICVDFLARNGAQCALRGYTFGSEDTRSRSRIPDDHPFARLIREPNPTTTWYQLDYGVRADRILYDNAFVWKASKGDARRLYRIPPAYITPKGGNIVTGPDRYELTTVSGPPKVLEPEEVIHFHGYDPVDPRVGASVLRALRNILREEVEASRQRSKFWERGARFGGFIERPKDASWSDTAFNRFNTGLMEWMRGGAREQTWMVLEDGMKPNPIGFSPQDAQFMEGREFALEMVATAMHIPLALLSRTDSQAFASVKEFHKILYMDTLGPWNADLEATWNRYLVSDFDDVDFAEYWIDEKLQGDFEQQAAAARQSVQVPWQSVNDMRRIRNMPPIGDPNDPANPYNLPARPGNYDYGTIPTRPDLTVVPNREEVA